MECGCKPALAQEALDSAGPGRGVRVETFRCDTASGDLLGRSMDGSHAARCGESFHRAVADNLDSLETRFHGRCIGCLRLCLFDEVKVLLSYRKNAVESVELLLSPRTAPV